METSDNTGFETILKQTIKEIKLESPSVDFTSLIMAKVRTASEPKITVPYKPLISKPVWWLLALFVGIVFSFILLGNRLFGITWFSETTYLWSEKFAFWEKIPAPTVSSTVVFGFVILAVFMSVQVVLLKHHFDKRIV